MSGEKVTHTPGPWRVKMWDGLVGLADGFEYIIIDRCGHGIATMLQKGEGEKVRANATIISCSPILLEQLVVSTGYLIGERDALYDACTNQDGEYIPGREGDNDRLAVAVLDGLIDKNRETIAMASGPL